ncbi:MAG: hypothetical protein A3H72_00770 [Candidatus Doudnabacteria bacterium RIFCSPLOWO2_02_FULL_48_8]|uniref:Uncharacterized protein n=1 Tax=Candidatus Doudnabacteria bacterium RIFCSPHIGHO2_01_FULL_46_24 TaxID=1817825 RepID=A0A1F5NUP0_9BACT|nr:MAG: hypothetical protein A2720_02505 [Candidatus Doudnabacteria bacterium RIFCSPHIGHO2_01_FULL_46_24]OGE94221.1 MAG: hypothetical protein A3E98_00150 [Candidatus Doudnabacteria bacterium RIFCSPHIGHO2_12_FULL_48_11]OGE95439.1 MAG: hypothetical protein A3H72_00770 [Candidatus Doudnabacteria bacterium RIFCSPLOWO2_02_FULL_48_8]
MVKEKYQSSEDEVANAEASMDQKQADLSEVRERELKALQEQSGLDQTTFNEIWTTLNTEGDNIKFVVRGHSVRFDKDKTRSVFVDDRLIDIDATARDIREKYIVAYPLANLDLTHFQDRVHAKSVEDLLK